jgi:hypothetical protein
MARNITDSAKEILSEKGNNMKTGTKSVLYGAHCFFLHPWFVAWGWWKLYGFPFDPRLWVAFFIHDLGYIGKPNMDGAEGETHPEFGARIMGIFGSHWGKFSLLHSRYYAKTLNQNPSRLCMADKMAIALTPAWLYLPMVRATGEIQEYMAHAKHRIVGNEKVSSEERAKLLGSQAEWYAGVRSYCRRWALEHADGKVDTWTSSARQRATIDDNGVWK